jgi:sugar lactone lactonase YvrE
VRANQVTHRQHPAPAKPGAKLRLLAFPLVIAALLAGFATPAIAAKNHQLITTFTTAPESGPESLAVDEFNGNVAVARRDKNVPSLFNGTVQIFGPEGGPPAGGIATTEIGGFLFTRQALAIDNAATSPSKGALYVATSSAPSFNRVVDKYVLNAAKEYEYLCRINSEGSGCTAAGNPAQHFIAQIFLAIDSKGNIFVSDQFGGFVYEFGPMGEDLARIPVKLEDGGRHLPEEIAVDSAGDLFVSISGEPGGGVGIYKYEANGSGEIEPGTEPVKFVPESFVGGTAIAIDRSNDHLYVIDYPPPFQHYRIAEYGPSGTLEGTFGKEALLHSPALPPTGLAVDSQSGKVYVSDGAFERVLIFAPGVLVPDATTGKASGETRTTATLEGSVSAAGGPAATCVFQYVDEAGFKAEAFEAASSVPCAPAGPFTGTGEETVSAGIGGLKAGTTYHYRLLAENENGVYDEVNEEIFQTQAAVTLKSGKASNLTPTSATLNGTINPEAIPVESCAFEYGEVKVEEPKAYGASVPCIETPAQIGSGNEAVSVHADISGLSPNTNYHFRLAASDSFGTTLGADSPFTSFGPPRIKAEAISHITPSEASVDAQVNPDGGATSYVVEYVSAEDFEKDEWAKATVVPPGGQAIGSGTEYVTIAQQVSGLSPFTAYHARLVATNSFGPPVIGTELIFTTYGVAGPGLPDARAYEQATPTDKNGSAPTGARGNVQAALGGNGITYLSGGGIPGVEGGQQFPNYLASRDSDWSNQGILPAAAAGSSAAVLGWSEDLSQVYDIQATLPKAPARFLARDSANHALRTITAGGGTDITEPAFVFNDATAHGSVVLFESNTPLSPGGAEKAFNTYAWEAKSGELFLVGILPDGTVSQKGSLAGSNVSNNVSIDHDHYTQAQQTLSGDGSRAFFTDPNAGQLYLRQNPTATEESCAVTGAACTVNVSASQRTIPPLKDKKPASFRGATPDGSFAFFTSSGKLTNDANTGPTEEGNDLYRYDTENAELIDIAPDGTDPNGAEVQGLLGTSDDGSYVYFVANGKFGSAPGVGDCKGSNSGNSIGTCNLYLWHEGAISFIAQLSGSIDIGYDFGGDADNWTSAPVSVDKPARVTADGQTLLFRSQRQLGAYDNHKTYEVYRYQVGDPGPACISCNPTGLAPVGPATLRSLQKPIKTIPSPASTLTRNLSADGNRVFFETPDKLIASDVNGEGGCEFLSKESGSSGPRTCQDVYEWEAEGAGSCESDDQNGGCLYLLSSGTSPAPSYFADADVKGDNAFFFTLDSLVAQDTDHIVDIYDARVGGGIASQNQPPPPDPCPSAEACKGSVTTPPATQSPGSSSFSGPGNPSACKKGKVRKRGRCVKKSHSHKRKQHKARRLGR